MEMISVPKPFEKCYSHATTENWSVKSRNQWLIGGDIRYVFHPIRVQLQNRIKYTRRQMSRNMCRRQVKQTRAIMLHISGEIAQLK